LSFAKQLVSHNNALQKCEPASILEAIVNIANTGLTLNPAMKHAYLIPYMGKASLMPSYQGLLHLLFEDSDYTNVVAEMVCEHDIFNYFPANFVQPIEHRPKLVGERGDYIGVYAIALNANGTCQSEFISIQDIYKIRECSQSYKAWQKNKNISCVWVDWFEEMARKTVVKRMFKYLAKTKGDKLSRAIELDNQEYKADLNQITYIDSLLNTANLQQEEVNRIEREMNGYTWSQANECINYLKDNQVSPLADGRYNMTEAGKMVAEAVENEKK